MANSPVLAHISAWGHLGPLWGVIRNAFGSISIGTANRALFVPIRVPVPMTVLGAWWLNGASVAGNIDVGIYNRDQRKIPNGVIGSTAQAGTSAIQRATFSTPPVIGPGLHFLALGASSASATFRTTDTNNMALQGKVLGLYQQDTAFALPDSATFATWSHTPGIPCFGLTLGAGSLSPAGWRYLKQFPSLNRIHTYSMESIGQFAIEFTWTGFASTASAVYPTANLALYFPFSVCEPFNVAKLFAVKGATISGNLDLGIYSLDGHRILSTGSVAQSAGANAIQEFDITDYLLGPGSYFMAIAMDNTTGTLFRGTVTTPYEMANAGIYQEASAFPLPATATFAEITTGYIPSFGLSQMTLI